MREIKQCVVEDVGYVEWTMPDPNWDVAPMPVARVRVDGERRAYYVTPDVCFRNRTTLRAEIVGKLGEVHFEGAHIVGFSCPS